MAGRRTEEGEAVVKEIESAGGEARFVQTDLTKEEQVKYLVEEAVRQFGRLDIAGYKTRIGAALLLVFLVLATYFFHDFWNFDGQEQQMQMIQFMKNLSLMGTMIFLMANGAGALSIDNKQSAVQHAS